MQWDADTPAAVLAEVQVSTIGCAAGAISSPSINRGPGQPDLHYGWPLRRLYGADIWDTTPEPRTRRLAFNVRG